VTGYPDPDDEVVSTPPVSPTAEAAEERLGSPREEAALHDSFLEEANRLLPKSKRRWVTQCC